MCDLRFGLEDIIAEYGGDVAVSYVHHPLCLHKYATEAARAVECAGVAGRFSEMKGVIYRDQRRLGFEEWEVFAEEAGGLDLQEFSNCMSQELFGERIAAGLAFGERIGLSAMPTLLINGWHFGGALRKEQLVSLIEGIPIR